MAIKVQNKNWTWGLNQIVSKSPCPIVAQIKRAIESAKILQFNSFLLLKQIFKQFLTTKYKNKTKYNLLKEYGELIGVDIEKYGYFFTYKMPKNKYSDALALIESKLEVNDALVLGKMKKLEYKIGYLKQNKKATI